jgi:hypothetical protein
VRGPDRSAKDGGDCTTTVIAPVVDGLFAATALGTGVAASIKPPCDPSRPSSGFFGPCLLDFTPQEHAAGAGLIALSVLEATAATYGGLKVAACREAKQKMAIPPSELEAAPSLRLGVARRD